MWLWAVVLCTAVPGPSAAQAPTADLASQGWWTSDFLVDYSIVLAGTSGYLVGERLAPRAVPLLGPAYAPDDPVPIFTDPDVSEPHLDRPTVPRRWIHGLLVAGGLLAAGLESGHLAWGNGSQRRLHDTAVGYMEAVAVTAAVTSLTKPWVGRLRPDFGERARRHHCFQTGDAYGDVCRGWRDDPLAVDPEEAARLLDDGRRSFPSGHASHSFNLLGYLALVVGGRYVWGEGAEGTGRWVGGASQAALLGTAGWISGTRVADGRHHLSDVLAGAALGLATANVSYWRRFGTDGTLRGSRAEGDSRMTRDTTHPGAGFPGVLLTVTLHP